MENDLKQKVAKLVLEIGEIATSNRVGDLIGFFQCIGRDGRKILRQIPWAAGFPSAQRRHDLKKAFNLARRSHHQNPDTIAATPIATRVRNLSELKNRCERPS